VKNRIRGSARFAAGADGVVDLATAVPLAGSSYSRADGAGLFWSMQQAPAGTSTPPSGTVELTLEVSGSPVVRRRGAA
jgi:hypothetical protein